MSEVQRSECVITDYLGCLICWVCNNEFTPIRADQKQCSKRCANVAAHRRRDQEREERQWMKTLAKNVAHRHLNRDRYIGFDGKYEGPLNQCFTVIVALRKDHGYHPMPIDVHVKPVEPKFTQITPEDVDWCDRQQAFPHSKTMPHLFKSFCASCTEVIVDGVKREVRVTKGIYTTKDHDCCVRVLDLQGKLLEVKKK
jgi:predicted nucleic acid-binding Zn ribbon protein